MKKDSTTPTDLDLETETDTTTTTTAAEPAVETTATFEPGAQVKHENGATYTVRFQNTEGVALEGVANMVHPSALRAI